MKHLSFLCLYTLVSFYGQNCVKSEAPSSYGERGSDFGIKVFQEIVSKKPEDNVVLSPHGVASILGMLLPGSHGETRRQILNALHFKKNGPYKMLKKLHRSLTAKTNEDIVMIANGMFSKPGFSMEKAFVATNKANYQCESRSLDFSDTQGAADKINEWVNNKTKGIIPNLIKADMLDPVMTRLVILNSIYFKGLWKSRFKPENTKMKPFKGCNGNVFKVQMMSHVSVFNTGMATTPQGLNYRVIELPYHGNTISMLVALPVEEDAALSDVIADISTATVRSWTKLMSPRKVRLFFPKFTADAEVDLKEALSALGLADLFSERSADFRNLSAEPVHVSKALQKAKIVVNEDGTKAAASTTAILMARSSLPWISVDRPFLFLVRHNPTGTILFMGQITQP
ncbi:glia-derived nexin [Genypterus blacodes]|uniref:glia-derived nexin n=1 Tax=Genypterus blacodes TaxID=154954 RepID=UPI003F767CE0